MTELLALNNLEPWGERRIELAVAWAAWQHWSAAHGKQPKGKKFRFRDFVVPLKADEPTAEEQDDAFLSGFKLLAGK